MSYFREEYLVDMEEEEEDDEDEEVELVVQVVIIDYSQCYVTMLVIREASYFEILCTCITISL